MPELDAIWVELCVLWQPGHIVFGQFCLLRKPFLGGLFLHDRFGLFHRHFGPDPSWVDGGLEGDVGWGRAGEEQRCRTWQLCDQWFCGFSKHRPSGSMFSISRNVRMSNSQILATSSFSTNHGIVPWIGEKLHIRAEFQQFSRNNMYVRVPGKLSEIHSKVLVFSNPGDNIKFLVKVRDRFAPLFLHLSGPCFLDWRQTRLWNVFLIVFQAPW